MTRSPSAPVQSWTKKKRHLLTVDWTNKAQHKAEDAIYSKELKEGPLAVFATKTQVIWTLKRWLLFKKTGHHKLIDLMLFYVERCKSLGLLTPTLSLWGPSVLLFSTLNLLREHRMGHRSGWWPHYPLFTHMHVTFLSSLLCEVFLLKHCFPWVPNFLTVLTNWKALVRL